MTIAQKRFSGWTRTIGESWRKQVTGGRSEEDVRQSLKRFEKDGTSTLVLPEGEYPIIGDKNVENDD